jgi:hypothetical protein
MDDPQELVVNMGVRCRDCGSEVKDSLSFKGFSIMETVQMMDTMRKKLDAHFDATILKDCEEAKKINICREVHDS